jgi:DNA topoisomerase-1
MGSKPSACKDIVRIDGQWSLRGEEITDKKTIDRINKMRIPPAWRNVAVSTDPGAKVQAVGMDAAGRWQYKYSAKHIESAARKKFDRVKLFSRDMGTIRKGIEKGIKKNEQEAFLLLLEDKTAIRAGSLADFKAKKKAYGLTTLQHEHVKIKGDKIILDFTAKEGILAHYELESKVLAKWLKKRKSVTKKGERLFPDVPARKVNRYLKKIAKGKSYTIKDFRTYHGTRIAYQNLKDFAGKALNQKEKKKVIKKVSTSASDFLKNTPNMAKNSYIDPMVWDFIGGL